MKTKLIARMKCHQSIIPFSKQNHEGDVTSCLSQGFIARDCLVFLQPMAA